MLCMALFLAAAGCYESPPELELKETVTVRTQPSFNIARCPKVVVLPFVSASEVADAGAAERLAEALAERLGREGRFDVVPPAKAAALTAEARSAYSHPSVFDDALAKSGGDAAICGLVSECAVTREPGVGLVRADVAVSVRVIVARGEGPVLRDERVTRYAWPGPGAPDPLAQAEQAVIARVCRLFMPAKTVIETPPRPLRVAAEFVEDVPVGERVSFDRDRAEIPLVLSLPAVCDHLPVSISVRREDSAVYLQRIVWTDAARFRCFSLRTAELLYVYGPGRYTARCRTRTELIGETAFTIESFPGYRRMNIATPKSLDEEMLWTGSGEDKREEPMGKPE